MFRFPAGLGLVLLLMFAPSQFLLAQSAEPLITPPPQTGGQAEIVNNREGQTPGFAEQSIDWLHKKLTPPGDGVATEGWSVFSSDQKKQATFKTAATVTLVLSISMLALFLLRLRPRRHRGGLPQDVVAVLGQVPFGPNQSLRLVRLASKLLLITTTPSGSQTLGEITDPEEVLQIEALCRDGKFDTIGQTLRQRARSTTAAPAARGNRFDTAGRTLLEA